MYDYKVKRVNDYLYPLVRAIEEQSVAACLQAKTATLWLLRKQTQKHSLNSHYVCSDVLSIVWENSRSTTKYMLTCTQKPEALCKKFELQNDPNTVVLK